MLRHVRASAGQRSCDAVAHAKMTGRRMRSRSADGLNPDARSMPGEAESVAKSGSRREMAETSPAEVTRLLLAWSDGDETALERLMPLVYAELRRLAERYMGREHAGHTLQTTALINEA